MPLRNAIFYLGEDHIGAILFIALEVTSRGFVVALGKIMRLPFFVNGFIKGCLEEVL